MTESRLAVNFRRFLCVCVCEYIVKHTGHRLGLLPA